MIFQSFPWLRLEFFSVPHHAREASPKKQMLPVTLSIGEARTVHGHGSVTVHPAMSVTELEEAFRVQCGLAVQVFRRSGNVWLETTVTDNWTLQEQNDNGQVMSELPH
jgi:hypothetical protein